MPIKHMRPLKLDSSVIGHWLRISVDVTKTADVIAVNLLNEHTVEVLTLEGEVKAIYNTEIVTFGPKFCLELRPTINMPTPPAS